jgi:hypothetical protein
VDLQAPVQYVKGVGPQRALALEKLGVLSAFDLLLHLPMRYEDRRSFARVADLRPGMRVSVSGEIAVAGLRRARRMTLYELRLDDGSGRLKAVFFNQPYLRETLPRGRRVVLYGLVERDAFASRMLVMRSPQYELVEGDEHGGIHTGRIVPVYEKLGPLTVKPLRRVLAHLAEQVPADVEDPLSAELRQRLGVIGRGEALRRVHLPGDEDALERLNAFRSPGHVTLLNASDGLLSVRSGHPSPGKSAARRRTRPCNWRASSPMGSSASPCARMRSQMIGNTSPSPGVNGRSISATAPTPSRSSPTTRRCRSSQTTERSERTRPAHSSRTMAGSTAEAAWMTPSPSAPASTSTATISSRPRTQLFGESRAPRPLASR